MSGRNTLQMIRGKSPARVSNPYFKMTRLNIFLEIIPPSGMQYVNYLCMVLMAK
jgi:hypothetical protein